MKLTKWDVRRIIRGEWDDSWIGLDDDRTFYSYFTDLSDDRQTVKCKLLSGHVIEIPVAKIVSARH